MLWSQKTLKKLGAIQTDQNQVQSFNLLKKFLDQQLITLETMKQKIEKENKENLKYQVENFVQAVCMKTDKREREAIEALIETDQLNDTLKEQLIHIYEDYYRCQHFVELLSMVTDDAQISKDWREKQQFFRFKSGYGRQMINEGNIEAIKMVNPFTNEKFSQILKSQASQYKLKTLRQRGIDQLNRLNEITKPQNKNQPNSQIASQQINKNSNTQISQQPQIQNQNQINQQQVTTGGSSKSNPRGPKYYQDSMSARKLAQNAISELDYNNIQNSSKLLRQAVEILEKYQ
ncbi:UNKNOWN [Stylonychia lemnae]|uniref:Uncharacterized protein n=1 Tax=Stylonychia lemnae TaxID=5949 RepID=A0A078BC73_STYLE|nr:UNKNOWN [Stylonychia lemnae]|eukprot:CDW91801.1 UNKNOWN [Stylonychia lemnae]